MLNADLGHRLESTRHHLNVMDTRCRPSDEKPGVINGPTRGLPAEIRHSVATSILIEPHHGECNLLAWFHVNALRPDGNANQFRWLLTFLGPIAGDNEHVFGNFDILLGQTFPIAFKLEMPRLVLTSIVVTVCTLMASSALNQRTTSAAVPARGAVVIKVQNGSEELGIKAGDIIFEYKGQRIRSY
jgi:hypothetical protein